MRYQEWLNSYRNRRWNGGYGGLEEWRGQLLFNGCGVSIWEHTKVLVMDGGDDYNIVNVCNASEQHIHK